MAFTQNPTQDSHNVTRILPRGSSFLVSTPYSGFNTQPLTLRYRNCFPITEEQWGTDAVRRVHTREGWTQSAVLSGSVTTTGSLSKSIVQTYTGGNVYVAKGQEVYRVNYIADTVALIDTRNDYGRGSGTLAISSAGVNRVAWLEKGGANYLMTCLEDGTSVTSTSLVAVNVDGSRGLVFIDGYLFAVSALGKRIYNSAAGGNLTTWNTTDFLEAEQYADNTIWIDKHKNYLVAFGEDSIEFFYNNAIEVGSPLARQESYSTRVGLYVGSSTTGGASVVNVEDDLYFLGRTGQNAVSLYVIKDFQVKEIKGQYIQGLLNNPDLTVSGITSILINNNPHIVINFTNDNPWAYFIKEDMWWQLSGEDYPDFAVTLGRPFVNVVAIGGSYTPECRVLTNASTGNCRWKYADLDYGTTVTSSMFTEIIDMGTNRYKHLARIDAIGDYGNNTLDLSINPTRNYSQTYTALGSKAVSTIGYQNNISWYNVGAPRAFILGFATTGTYPSIHEGFDIEYTTGVA